MKDFAIKLIENQYNQVPLGVTDLGGGFYGKVFGVKLNDESTIVVKFHLINDLAWKEKAQLEALSKAAIFPMPNIKLLFNATEEIPYDAIVMDFLVGENAGCVLPDSDEFKKQVAEDVVDNLIAFHNTIHQEGFGEIYDTVFHKDWRDFYKKRVDIIYEKSKFLIANGLLSKSVIECIDDAYSHYWDIFNTPIETASLIHGDYNMWNIMLSKDWHVSAIIDPCGCCYGDAEYDLYQLDNANGKDYGLLDLYKTKRQVSKNCDLKMAVYQVFTEIMHYCDSGVTPILDLLQPQCENLVNQMKKFNII